MQALMQITSILKYVEHIVSAQMQQIMADDDMGYKSTPHLQQCPSKGHT